MILMDMTYRGDPIAALAAGSSPVHTTGIQRYVHHLILRSQPMHPTRNDLPDRSRVRLEKLLNQRLADALDLQATR